MRHEWPETAAEAFQRVDWRRITPRLHEHAYRCMRLLGWNETKSQRPAVMEASEVVNMVIESFLTGDRTWVPEKTRTEDELVAFLCMTIWGEAMNRRTSASVTKKDSLDAIDKNAEPRGTPETILHERQVLEQIEQTIADDPEICALYRALIEGGGSRDELAIALDWRPERVKLVYGRMRDRLARRGITRHGAREEHPHREVEEEE